MEVRGGTCVLILALKLWSGNAPHGPPVSNLCLLAEYLHFFPLALLDVDIHVLNCPSPGLIVDAEMPTKLIPCSASFSSTRRKRGQDMRTAAGECHGHANVDLFLTVFECSFTLVGLWRGEKS